MCLKAVFVVALQSMLFVSANYSNENVEIFNKLSELENKVSVLTGKLESCKCSTSEDDSITSKCDVMYVVKGCFSKISPLNIILYNMIQRAFNYLRYLFLFVYLLNWHRFKTTKK